MGNQAIIWWKMNAEDIKISSLNKEEFAQRLLVGLSSTKEEQS